MARLFDDASSQYALIASAAVTAPPFSMSCWFNVDNTTNAQGLMRVYNNASNNANNHQLYVGNTGRIHCQSTNNAGTSGSDQSGFLSLNTWQSAIAVWASNSSRRVWLDGSSPTGGDLTSISPSGINATAIGGFIDTAPDRYLSGMMADAAIWNVALSAAEIAILAEGISPLAVCPGNLIAYWPLWGAHSPEIDLKGGFPLTLTNGPTKADHPRMRYLAQSPNPGVFGTFSQPVGGGASSGWIWVG